MYLARPALGTSAMQIESDFGLSAIAMDPGPHPLACRLHAPHSYRLRLGHVVLFVIPFLLFYFFRKQRSAKLSKSYESHAIFNEIRKTTIFKTFPYMYFPKSGTACRCSEFTSPESELEPTGFPPMQFNLTKRRGRIQEKTRTVTFLDWGGTWAAKGRGRTRTETRTNMRSGPTRLLEFCLAPSLQFKSLLWKAISADAVVAEG